MGRRDEENDNDEEEKDEAALAVHLSSVHDLTSSEAFNKTFVFTILEIEPKNINKSEQKWISFLSTMTPYGLNIEKPLRVADSILSIAEIDVSERH